MNTMVFVKGFIYLLEKSIKIDKVKHGKRSIPNKTKLCYS
jgi:hypothetical protein